MGNCATMKDDSNDPIEASTLNILITNIIYS
jgi:hypothetical protein